MSKKRFGDLAIAAHHGHALPERDGRPGGIHDHIGAHAAGHPQRHGHRIRLLGVHDHIGAQLAGQVEAGAVLRGARDEDRARPLQAGHLDAKEANGPGAEDGYEIAGADARLFHQGVVGHAEGLGEGRIGQGHARGHVVEDLLADGHIAGESAVLGEAEGAALGADVVLTGAAEAAGAAGVGMGLGGHPVAHGKAAHLGAHLDDHTRELVAQDERRPQLVRYLVVVDVDFAAADAARLDLDEHLVGADGGAGHLADIDAPIFLLVEDDSFHGVAPSGWLRRAAAGPILHGVRSAGNSAPRGI